MPTSLNVQLQGQLGAKSPPTFEFPKRKRWADLLLTELADNIAFIISPTCKIWFCAPPVTELLGWRDTDILDLDFTDLIDSTDHARFRELFDQSIQHAVEFDLPIKLKKCEPPVAFGGPVVATGKVFNIKCYPHTVREPEPEVKCLIAMATPYPSRNTAILDTILDLKAKQDRLQRRVAELQSRLPPNSQLNFTPSPPTNGPIYATSSLNTQRVTSSSISTARPAMDHSGTYLSSGNSLSNSLDDHIRSRLDTTDFTNTVNYPSATGIVEEPVEEGSKKKKMKRAQNAEQYVCITCGRTDSPEWRKGPLGPKTLCNACGLRWAKQMRKDEAGEGVISEVA